MEKDTLTITLKYQYGETIRDTVIIDRLLTKEMLDMAPSTMLPFEWKDMYKALRIAVELMQPPKE